MLRHGLRLSVAILTFMIGVALVWALGLIPRLETALVDRFFTVDDSAMNALSPGFVDPTADANQIYRLLIREKFTFDGTRLIVLNSDTIGYAMYEDDTLRARFGESRTYREWLRDLMPQAESETVDDYFVKNQTREPLRISDLGINYAMFSQSDFSDDQVYDFWTKFEQEYRYSSGLISFSDVGFNEQHDQAFVYAARSCGGLCGEGAYFLLKKVNGKWEIVREQNLWVS